MLSKIGIHLNPWKHTAECTPVVIPVPERVTLTLSTYRGSVNEPSVKVGDHVEVGQEIAPPSGGLAVPVHATVSGTVESIGVLRSSDGAQNPSVTIRSDRAQTVWAGIKPPTVTHLEEFVAAVRACGLTGLGGAGFPTWAKLSAGAEILLLNGSECEPFCTADYHIMCSRPEDILEGALLVRKYVGIPKLIVGVKESNTKALSALKKAAEGMADVEIRALKGFYPVGAEKMCIQQATGRIVPRGKLPKDVGVIVLNVGTAAAIAEYIRTGMPLVKRTVTLDGSAVKQPGMVVAPIGTPIGALFAAVGGFQEEPSKVLMGGPMMGVAIPSLDLPLMKQNNTFLALNATDAKAPGAGACIRCGRCVRACPMKLMPAGLFRARKGRNGALLDTLCADLCIECGVCSYVCPAKIDLVGSHRLAKPMLRAYQQEVKGK